MDLNLTRDSIHFKITAEELNALIHRGCLESYISLPPMTTLCSIMTLPDSQPAASSSLELYAIQGYLQLVVGKDALNQLQSGATRGAKLEANSRVALKNDFKYSLEIVQGAIPKKKQPPAVCLEQAENTAPRASVGFA